MPAMAMFSAATSVIGHGRVIATLLDTRIRSESRVFASASEFRATRLVSPGFIGGARIFVANVTPREGAVDIWVQIDWESDLEVHVSILIDT